MKLKPDAEWYVFVEADTYLSWDDLLEWLPQFESSKPRYIGEATWIGGTAFAHGGSGWIVSNPVMHMASERHMSALEDWNTITTEEWAGDCVFGRLLSDVGIPVLNTWPLLQGQPPLELDFTAEAYDKRLWCSPPVSYHHVTAADIAALCEFEQDWRRNVSVPAPGCSSLLFR